MSEKWFQPTPFLGQFSSTDSRVDSIGKWRWNCYATSGCQRDKPSYGGQQQVTNKPVQYFALQYLRLFALNLDILRLFWARHRTSTLATTTPMTTTTLLHFAGAFVEPNNHHHATWTTSQIIWTGQIPHICRNSVPVP